MQTNYTFSEVELAHIEKLRQWASDRNLVDPANTVKQLGKTCEELGELVKACFKGDDAECLDALGDVWVTLIVGAIQNNFVFEQDEHFFNNYAAYYDAIVEDTLPSSSLFIVIIGDIAAGALRGTLTKARYLEALYLLKSQFEVWLDDSIEMVWGVISKRTGKTVNGVFLKTEDLQDEH